MACAASSRLSERPQSVLSKLHFAAYEIHLPLHHRKCGRVSKTITLVSLNNTNVGVRPLSCHQNLKLKSSSMSHRLVTLLPIDMPQSHFTQGGMGKVCTCPFPFPLFRCAMEAPRPSLGYGKGYPTSFPLSSVYAHTPHSQAQFTNPCMPICMDKQVHTCQPALTHNLMSHPACTNPSASILTCSALRAQAQHHLPPHEPIHLLD